LNSTNGVFRPCRGSFHPDPLPGWLLSCAASRLTDPAGLRYAVRLRQRPSVSPVGYSQGSAGVAVKVLTKYGNMHFPRVLIKKCRIMNLECRTEEVKSTSKFDIVVFPVAIRSLSGTSDLNATGLPVNIYSKEV
jgi:hypothetical protein